MTSPAAGVFVRPIEPGDELTAAWRLTLFAFGAQGELAAHPSPPAQFTNGRILYGAYDSGGRLIGAAAELCHEQWWGGRLVPAADVAGVAVLPEARGSGAARALMKGLLEGAYERGAAISTLYPTASAVYRASGWAVCGFLRTAEVATALLPTNRVSVPNRLTVRPADPGGADQPAVLELYTRLARVREGMLSRQGAPFPPADSWPRGIDGITLVEDGDRLVGYASWNRGTGYRSEALLDVPDLIAATPDAARELMSVLAGWRSVTPTVRLRTLDFDASSALLPLEAATRLDARPWMLRPVDVSRALSSRGWPSSRRGKVTFHLHDSVAPWNDGAWQFDVADGEATLVRTGNHPDLRLHVAGFALLYSGAATPGMLIEAGLLHGPVDCIGGLELLRPKSPAQLLDYF